MNKPDMTGYYEYVALRFGVDRETAKQMVWMRGYGATDADLEKIAKRSATRPALRQLRDASSLG